MPHRRAPTPTTFRPLILAAALSTVTACASTSPAAGLRFPSRAELERLTAAPPPGAEEAARALVARVNELRRRHDVDPAELDEAQARLACRLAPRYLAATARGDAQVADAVALGMRAGWEVDAVVREGWFAASVGVRTRDLDAWLATSLEHPTLRRSLLDPRVSRLAPCPLRDDAGDVRAVLWGAYDTVQPGDLRADLRAWVQRVLRRRAALGLPTPFYDQDLTGPIDRGLARLQDGAVDLHDVLREVLAEGASSAAQSVHGVVVQGRSGDDAEVPTALTEEPQLTMAVGGAYWRPAGHPWARLVIFALDTSGRSGRMMVTP